MNFLRLSAIGSALALVVCASGARAATYNVNCGTGTVSGATTASGTPSTILGMVLGTSSSLPTVSPAPASGDIIEITSICTQDVMVTTSGLTITNDNNSASLKTSDGIQGQLDIAAATGIVINGILLGSTSTFGFANASDVAVLSLHDGASATVTNAEISHSPLLGVLAARSSKVLLTSTLVTANGGGSGDTLERDNGGIQARDNGAVVLGNSDGSGSVSITTHAFDAVSAYRNGSVVVYSATLTGNTAHQMVAVSASSLTVNLASSVITAPVGALTAIQAIGTSTIQIDAGVSLTGATDQEAISILGGSALLLQGSNVAAPGLGPVIEASSGSVIALAGGNHICNGTLSGSTCTASGNLALVIDHVASLVQVDAADFGFTAAVDTVTGGGVAQLQSTIDIGRGLIGGQPSISWAVGAKWNRRRAELFAASQWRRDDDRYRRRHHQPGLERVFQQVRGRHQFRDVGHLPVDDGSVGAHRRQRVGNPLLRPSPIRATISSPRPRPRSNA